MAIIQNRADAERVARLLQTRDDIPEATRRAMMDDLRNFHNSQLAAEAQDVGFQDATDPSFLNQLGRKAAIIGESAAIGAGDTLDFIASPLTYAAMKAGQAAGWVDPNQQFMGDEGFADISSLIDRSIDGVDPVTGTEQALANISRVAGGAIGGVGLGRSLAAAGARGLGAQAGKTLAQQSPQAQRAYQALSSSGNWLAAQPVIQAGAAVTGEGLRMAAEAAGAGAGWQLGYSLAGSLGYGMFAPRAWNSIAKIAGGIKDDPSSVAAQNALVNLNEELSLIGKLNDEFNSVLGEAGLPINDAAPLSPIGRLPDDSWTVRQLRNIPGGRGKLDDQIEQVEEQIAELVRKQESVNLTGDVPQAIDASVAGQALRSGTESAIVRFKNNARSRYNALDEAVKELEDSGRTIDVTTTQTSQFFDNRDANEWTSILGSDKMAQIEEAFRKSGVSFAHWVASKVGQNLDEMSPKARELLERLVADAAAERGVTQLPTTMSYQSMRNLRKELGSMLNSPSVFNDAPTAELVALRRAITDDIQTALRQTDQLSALQIRRPTETLEGLAIAADDYYHTNRSLFDEKLAFITQRIVGDKVAPERLFEGLWNNSKIAGSSVEALKDQFQKAGRMDEWKTVAHAFVERLGKATPGRQDAGGTRFSLATFLTRWNQMDKTARQALFKGIKSAGEKRDLYDILNDVALVAARAGKLKQTRGGRDISQVLIAGGPLGGIGASVATGNPMFLVGMLLAGVGTRGAAQLMTSTKFLKAVRDMSTKKSLTPAAIAQILASAGDEHPEEAAKLLQGLRELMLSDGEMTTDGIRERNRQ